MSQSSILSMLTLQSYGDIARIQSCRDISWSVVSAHCPINTGSVAFSSTLWAVMAALGSLLVSGWRSPLA